MKNYLIRRSKITAVMLWVILALACSNALTESSAAGLLQEFLDKQGQASPDNTQGLVVESCERLVLLIETTASARCTVRSKNNSTDVYSVEFGKKPDGGWIVTTYSYSRVY